MATLSSVLAWRIPGTGAWWATFYGVVQSRTRLTWLSSGSSRGTEWASQVVLVVKNLLPMQEMWVRSLGQEDPLQEGVAATPVFLPGESPGRSLAGYSPSGHKESDMIQWLSMHTHVGWMQSYNEWRPQSCQCWGILKYDKKMLILPWELKKTVNWYELRCCWAVPRWEGVLTVSCCFLLLLKRGVPELWPQHHWRPLWHLCPWVLWEGDRLGQWLLSVHLSSQPACQVSTQVCWHASAAHRRSGIASMVSFTFQGFHGIHLSGYSSCVQKS